MGASDNVTVMITDQEKALVGNIANKIFKKYCSGITYGKTELTELYHLGIIGLLEAKKNFDPDQKVPFKVFASYRIRGAMMDHIRYSPLVRMSQDMAGKVKELKKAMDRASRRGERKNIDQLARELGWPVPEVRKVMIQFISVVPAMDRERRERDDPASYQAEILVDTEPDAEARVLTEELGQLMEQCMENLPSDEFRIILKARVLEGMPLRELAQIFKVSIQTVANRQEMAQRLMKDCLERTGWSLEDYEKIFK
jgi:RNA polymerase sigma factor for flagellar operon FliA